MFFIQSMVALKTILVPKGLNIEIDKIAFFYIFSIKI